MLPAIFFLPDPHTHTHTQSALRPQERCSFAALMTGWVCTRTSTRTVLALKKRVQGGIDPPELVLGQISN